MKRNELIAYSMDFISFLMKDNKISNDINRVILFGSVARGDFEPESDIDLFIETNFDEKIIYNRLNLFYDSPIGKTNRLKGLENEFSIIVGDTSDFKGLQESMEDSGIQLYGIYEKSKKNIFHYTLFKISLERKKTATQVKLWRKIYGYRQKVGKKTYESKGLINYYNAVKIANGVFIIPFKHRQKMLEFLNTNKIIYFMYDIYSNDFIVE